MSDPVSRQPFPAESARGGTALAGRLPAAACAQDPQSPFEREIARSERASAALAATRALARAATADSQDLVEGADDDPRWMRTQYSDSGHSVLADAELAGDRSGRSPVGGSFDPGIVAPQGRAVPAAAMAAVPSKTRTGVQARVRPESRQAPRDARSGDAAAPRAQAHRAEPGMTPVQAATSAAPSRPAAPARAPARAGLKYLRAAGFGVVVVVLAGGGIAWKAGLASHGGAARTVATLAAAPLAATTAPAAAAQQDQAPAESARALSPVQPETPVASAPAASEGRQAP